MVVLKIDVKLRVAFLFAFSTEIKANFHFPQML